ncbi:AAA family ATPase [Azospirillum sp. Vi22]|uniref:AAA family ATPase n=1 Tax=Azospirillum baldaniorum TaxID=1064539 RepID=UPI00157AC5E0|nr:AAA family ATPase [Azospirillum baldaniorum]NUB04894.1 AAA family ATPase [Azospirillum baldaniorum]
MSEIVEFRINSLFGSYDVVVPMTDNSAIIVGPNGTGKSTILNIIYYYITRQWGSLTEFNFKSIEVIFNDKRISTTKEEIEGAEFVREQSSALPTKYQRYLDIVQIKIGLSKFVDMKLRDLQRIAPALGISYEELRRLRMYVAQQIEKSSNIFSAKAAKAFSDLTQFMEHKVLYLPTYRRIEKDINVVFPDFEGEMRARAERGLIGKRKEHFIELVSFGMEDVKKQFRDVLEDLRFQSNSELNSLSGIYLRDVIRGEADNFDKSFISSLSDDEIDSILERVEEKTLSTEDKRSLKDAITSIKNRKGGRTGRMVAKEKYAAYYFSKLATVTRSMKEKGRKIKEFVDICNDYFGDGKRFGYDEVQYSLLLLRKDGALMELSELSSGEKQIVSILAHLYLGSNDKYIVFIDEPELSLSVIWQKRFLSDIMKSGHCAALLAVTHSPFIFSNELKSSVRDIKRLISYGDKKNG